MAKRAQRGRDSPRDSGEFILHAPPGDGSAALSTALSDSGLWPEGAGPTCLLHVRFSNRPFGVKRFQTINHHSVDVAHGLVLLFGIGTKALPSWDSKTRWNNLMR